MADELDDGEFWLPSQFLTEEDILMDFEGSRELSNKGSSGSLSSDTVSPVDDSITGGGSTGAESDEDDFLAGLTRQISLSSLHDCVPGNNPKRLVLPGSPQSTLCPVGAGAGGGCGDSCGFGSSRGSPNGPVSPSPMATEGDFYRTIDAASFNLLNAAAGEVARMRLLQQQGTGYFDSSRGVRCPQRNRGSSHSFPVSLFPSPAKKNCNNHHPQQATKRPHLHGGAIFSQNNHQLSHTQFQALQFQLLRKQQMTKQQSNNKRAVWPPSKPVSGQFQTVADQSCVTPHHPRKNRSEEFFNGYESSISRPLDPSPSAWPPLRHHQDRHAPPPPASPGTGMRAVFLGPTGTKKECAGTGVFLPRRADGRCGAPNESRKTSDKPTCSTVLLPEKVVQALNNINSQSHGLVDSSVVRFQNNPSGNGSQALKRSSNNACPQGNVEIQLPSEWTY